MVDPFVQGCVSVHLLFESQLSKLLILRSQFLRLHNWFAHPVLNRLHCPCRVLVRISKLWVQIFRYKEVVGTFIWKSPGKSGFTTFPSFPDMYKIEDRIELDLKRNVRCHCSKWSTVWQAPDVWAYSPFKKFGIDYFYLLLSNFENLKIQQLFIKLK